MLSSPQAEGFEAESFRFLYNVLLRSLILSCICIFLECYWSRDIHGNFPMNQFAHAVNSRGMFSFVNS